MPETTTEVPTPATLVGNQARLVQKLQQDLLAATADTDWRDLREGVAALTSSIDKLVSLEGANRPADPRLPSGDLTGSVTFPGKGKYADTPGLPDERLQMILAGKDAEAAREHGRPESWQIIDSAIVIYDYDSPPVWLKPVLEARDENGNTNFDDPIPADPSAAEVKLSR